MVEKCKVDCDAQLDTSDNKVTIYWQSQELQENVYDYDSVIDTQPKSEDYRLSKSSGRSAELRMTRSLAKFGDSSLRIIPQEHTLDYLQTNEVEPFYDATNTFELIVTFDNDLVEVERTNYMMLDMVS